MVTQFDRDSSHYFDFSFYREGFLFLLVIGLVLVEKYDWLNNLNRAYGILLSINAGWWLLRRRSMPLPEVVLFSLFIIWTLITGFVVSVDKENFWLSERLVVQELALLLIVVEFTIRKKNASFIFFTLLFLAIFSAGYSYFIGEVARVSSSKWDRASSIVYNPNLLGFLGLFGYFSIIYMIQTHAKNRWIYAYAAMIPIVVGVIVLSGSRKSFIALILFTLTWLFFQYKSCFFRHIRRVILIGIMLLVFYYGVTAIMEHTVLGRRFHNTMRDPRFDSSRYSLYKKGWNIFLNNPVAGVGLGGFMVASGTGTFSHSDYIEVLSTSGLVGFFVYFSIYPVLWYRLRKVERQYPRVKGQKRIIDLYKAIVLTLLFLGMGTPNFMSPFHWIIIGAIAGHSLTMIVDFRRQDSEDKLFFQDQAILRSTDLDLAPEPLDIFRETF